MTFERVDLVLCLILILNQSQTHKCVSGHNKSIRIYMGFILGVNTFCSLVLLNFKGAALVVLPVPAPHG